MNRQARRKFSTRRVGPPSSDSCWVVNRQRPVLPLPALTGPAIACRSGINELRPTETAEQRVIGTSAFWPNLYGSQPDAPPARIYSEVLDGWIESRKTEVERRFPRWRST